MSSPEQQGTDFFPENCEHDIESPKRTNSFRRENRYQHFRVASKPLRRNNFTLAEKLEVFEFKRKNPKESKNKIAQKQ